MTKRNFWIGLFVIVGGCVALSAINGDDEVSAGTRNACGEFRDAQADPPDDATMIELMLDLAEFDTSAPVHTAALNLADQLEVGSRADLQDAVARMDAACEASDL